MSLGAELRRTLAEYAERYETAAFLDGDPSWFMHQVEGDANREATAFVASALSFGSRSQFMPKIHSLLDAADGDIDSWVRSGRFSRSIRRGSCDCFYRFHTHGAMHDFLEEYRRVLDEFGTLGALVRGEALGDGLRAVKSICGRFAQGGGGVVPKDATSACKRVCMFLRWMVRGGSPVDLGLWEGFIDRRTLVVPLDVHVARESVLLGLVPCAGSTMSSARRVTAALAEAFPDDPLKGDFALFGLGVNGGTVVDHDSPPKP